MTNNEKYCLKWNEFESNIRESFRKLRDEERLFDVTLATDDGHHIEAHKLILSAGSHFFNNIFMKSNHANMLIYLKGINSVELEYIIAFITQEELKRFLETVKEMQVKDLHGDLQNNAQNEPEKQGSNYHNTNHDEKENEYAKTENIVR